MRTRLVAGLLAIAILAICTARAQACAREDFGRVIDGAGEAIRSINAEMTPKLAVRLSRLKASQGLDDKAVAARASAAMQDPAVTGADRQVSELLGRIEALGDIDESAEPDCGRLAELEANVVELRAAIRTKWASTFAGIDKLDPGKIAAAPKVAAVAKPPKTAGKVAETLPWSSEATPEPGYQPGAGAVVAALPADPPFIMLEELSTYSIEEIQGAGRGFFGNISVGLAGVIGHVFEQAGRPNGYILGKEGGGAIVAGLRYGEGRLHTKLGGSQRIFWQGPSIGYDLGVDGTRTLILVYNLKQPASIFARFGGIDGSAFVVGGVGATFVTDGDVILAPIRSGLGLRLGANIGYLKFTPERTWNPF